MSDFDLSLYLVLDRQLCGSTGMVETARRAVAGGVTMVQLRDKDATTAGMIATGRELKQALAGTGVALIINDDIEAALEIGADGVHIGQGDLPVPEVRWLIGPDMILGLSVETLPDVLAASAAQVDYLGVGPVFSTTTKPDHKTPIGFDGLAKLIAAGPLPCVAIGGIKPAHIPQALDAGAKGVAVVSAICGQTDPQAAAGIMARSIADWRQARDQS